MSSEVLTGNLEENKKDLLRACTIVALLKWTLDFCDEKGFVQAYLSGREVGLTSDISNDILKQQLRKFDKAIEATTK